MANMVHTLINHADRVKIACMAQLANVIAPIVTENQGKAWEQPIIHSDKYDSKEFTDVPYLDSAVVLNEERNELVLFMTNRHLEESLSITYDLRSFEQAEVVEHIVLGHDDPKAVNTKDREEVTPHSGGNAVLQDKQL